jgi:hypothetical protein
MGIGDLNLLYYGIAGQILTFWLNILPACYCNAWSTGLHVSLDTQLIKDNLHNQSMKDTLHNHVSVR